MKTKITFLAALLSSLALLSALGAPKPKPSPTPTPTPTPTPSPTPTPVTVCHKGQTILVQPDAVNSHLAHGDYLGACNVTPNQNQ